MDAKSLISYLFCLLLTIYLWTGCESSDTTTATEAGVSMGGVSSGSEDQTQGPSYDLPNEQISEIFATSYIYPYQVCVPRPSDADISSEYISITETGEEEVCVWQNAQGCAPEGERFTEWGSCEVAMTTSARFYKNPGSKYQSDLMILEDEDYQRESQWVQDQIRSCGCVCCHDAQENGIQANFATAFDVSFPGVWTDTFTDFGLLTAAGVIDTELLGGTFDPQTNFGFDRSELIFPSSDIERMRRFFTGEIQRRALSEERIQELIDAVPLRFAGLYTNYAGETVDCEPDIGVDTEGYIHWGNNSARHVYVLEDTAKNVADPPGLDRPEGTLWRLDAKVGVSFESGTIRYGEIPDDAKQDIPVEGEPIALESGQRYKLFILRDFGPLRLQNCYFTF